MSTIQSLQKLRGSLKLSERMPLIFLGHGNPMNAIEDNAYSRGWTEMGRTLKRPQAILVLSAHWMTRGTTLVDVSAKPKTIHDFHGFPQALFDQQYPAQGHPELAHEIVTLLSQQQAQADHSWGLDHGAWSVLKFLYPEADIPVFQISINLSKKLDWHLEFGKTLSQLRDRGVLILGSGNIVHNLSALRFDGKRYDWAQEFDQKYAGLLRDRNFQALADERELGSLLNMAHPTLEHYIPSLSIAGAASARDELFTFNEDFDLGSISMRSFVFHSA